MIKIEKEASRTKSFDMKEKGWTKIANLDFIRKSNRRKIPNLAKTFKKLNETVKERSKSEAVFKIQTERTLNMNSTTLELKPKAHTERKTRFFKP